MADLVEIIPGDARETLATFPGPFDLVFVDAWKSEYPTYLDLVYPKLRAGGIIVANNVSNLSDDPGIQAYVMRVRDYPKLESITVPIGNGQELSVKRPSALPATCSGVASRPRRSARDPGQARSAA